MVDKATKLQTIYDRIHLIDTRFEVVKRDAEIRKWKSIAEGVVPAEAERIHFDFCQKSRLTVAFCIAPTLAAKNGR